MKSYKQILENLLPTHKKISTYKYLKIFGNSIHKRGIWSVNRKKISLAIFVGIFIALIPLPFQMVIVAALAIYFEFNLPTSIMLVWITNPLTMPFIFYFETYIGSKIFNIEIPNFDKNFFNDIFNNSLEIIISLYAGALVLSIVLSITITIIFNILWVYRSRNKYKNRNQSSGI